MLMVPLIDPPARCPEPGCDSLMAVYGKDYKECGICGRKEGPQGVIRRGNPPKELEVASAAVATVQVVPLEMVPVGVAHTERAQNEVAPAKKAGTEQPRVPTFRSAVRKAIYVSLMKDPSLSNLEICRGLDEDGFELSRKLRVSARSFEDAYKSRKLRDHVASIISKVKNKMRRSNLL